MTSGVNVLHVAEPSFDHERAQCFGAVRMKYAFLLVFMQWTVMACQVAIRGLFTHSCMIKGPQRSQLWLDLKQSWSFLIQKLHANPYLQANCRWQIKGNHNSERILLPAHTQAFHYELLECTKESGKVSHSFRSLENGYFLLCVVFLVRWNRNLLPLSLQSKSAKSCRKQHP